MRARAFYYLLLQSDVSVVASSNSFESIHPRPLHQIGALGDSSKLRSPSPTSQLSVYVSFYSGGMLLELSFTSLLASFISGCLSCRCFNVS